jgi:hypothetical protein
LYRRRSFFSGRIQNDFVLNNGLQFSSGKGRIVWEFMYGGGVRLVNDSSELSGLFEVFDKVKFVVPASIKIGYKF